MEINNYLSAIKISLHKQLYSLKWIVCGIRGNEVEELCRGSLEAVSSLYPALRNLQRISELESIRQLFSKYDLPSQHINIANIKYLYSVEIVYFIFDLKPTVPHTSTQCTSTNLEILYFL